MECLGLHAVTADRKASYTTLSVDVHREFQMNCFYFMFSFSSCVLFRIRFRSAIAVLRTVLSRFYFCFALARAKCEMTQHGCIKGSSVISVRAIHQRTMALLVCASFQLPAEIASLLSTVDDLNS